MLLSAKAYLLSQSSVSSSASTSARGGSSISSILLVAAIFARFSYFFPTLSVWLVHVHGRRYFVQLLHAIMFPLISHSMCVPLTPDRLSWI